MKNEFLEALGSNNANNNTDLSLYSRFVGNWSFTMTTYDEEGKIEDTKWTMLVLRNWTGKYFFHMSWMGMEFKMSSFVPKEENGQRKILYTEIMEQQYEFQ